MIIIGGTRHIIFSVCKHWLAYRLICKKEDESQVGGWTSSWLTGEALAGLGSFLTFKPLSPLVFDRHMMNRLDTHHHGLQTGPWGEAAVMI